MPINMARDFQFNTCFLHRHELITNDRVLSIWKAACFTNSKLYYSQILSQMLIDLKQMKPGLSVCKSLSQHKTKTSSS